LYLSKKSSILHWLHQEGIGRPERQYLRAVLGFEDCSAKTVAVSSSELSLTQPWMRQHEQLAPKAWSFYSFDVVPEDYQIVINVAAEVDNTCEPTGSSKVCICKKIIQVMQ
jgi:hypothetical protein